MFRRTKTHDLTSRTTRTEPEEQAKAHLKKSVEALKHAYVEADVERKKVEADALASAAINAGIAPPPEPPSPIAELCADIVAHPGDYGFFETQRTEKAWLVKTLTHKRDDSIFLTQKEFYWGAWNVFAPWGVLKEGAEVKVADEAFEYHEQYRRACGASETISCLAKVKAERPATIKGPTWTIEAPAERTVTAYMCEIAWDHELGEDAEGTVLYPSIHSLDRQHRAKDCGIVEVEVRLKRIVREADDTYAPAERTVTIENHTPGDPTPAMRDFLLAPGAITPKKAADIKGVKAAAATAAGKLGTFYSEPAKKCGGWPDSNGVIHSTRAAMRQANAEIENSEAYDPKPAKRKKKKAGAP